MSATRLKQPGWQQHQLQQRQLPLLQQQLLVAVC